jgi:5-formyltetrahydrofolate cyclo-ligase
MDTAKSAVRKEIKSITSRLSAALKRTLSEQTLQLLEAEPRFQEAHTVALFWSLPDEIDTHAFIEKWSSEKIIVLPVMEGSTLAFARFMGEESLAVNNNYSIHEPAATPMVTLSQIDVMVVPGEAFDKAGNRLGRGKGFYDRALQEYGGYKLGICFPHQFVASVPTEDTDVRMDKVIVV